MMSMFDLKIDERHAKVREEMDKHRKISVTNNPNNSYNIRHRNVCVRVSSGLIVNEGLR